MHHAYSNKPLPESNCDLVPIGLSQPLLRRAPSRIWDSMSNEGNSLASLTFGTQDIKCLQAQRPATRLVEGERVL